MTLNSALTHANLRMICTSLKSITLYYLFADDSMGLSSFTAT